MAKRPRPRIYWCVRYRLKGKLLFETQVEAASKEQALAVAKGQEGRARRNLRRLADEIAVEKVG